MIKWLRERWLVLVLALAGGAFAAVIGIVLADFPTAAERYATVALGDKRSEVLYRLGYPPIVVGTRIASGEYVGSAPLYYTDGHDPKNVLPPGSGINDYSEWQYGDNDGYTVVGFDKGCTVAEIGCFVFAADRTCPALLGITIGLTEEEVISRLGKPTRFKLDGVAKTLRYDDLSVEYVLTKGRVYASEVRKDTSAGLGRAARIWSAITR